ncbi:MAG: sulfatase-like hydrolase/transferase, partial [Epsilonproteobacteria bacterium]|nr:sulfatase-like hydrolase/transferase [Campylobacterota bacterium]
LIILHTMGSHGPAYYKRYPKRFEKFKPVCKTNQLEKCSKEEIINAYDNTILYSDYFLDKSINFLKRYKDAKRALIYISDHGESLGEGGLYLHGMPYFIAPDAQKHVAAFIWLGDNLKKEIDTNYLRSLQNKKLHQNILFHTLLAIFDVNSSVYKEDLNILKRRD